MIGGVGGVAGGIDGDTLGGASLDVTNNWWDTVDEPTVLGLMQEPSITDFLPILTSPPGLVCPTLCNLSDDELLSMGYDMILEGTPGNDNLVGANNKNVVLRGKNGNDTLRGNAGNDLILGEGGDDELHGGSGNDDLDGAHGNDLIYGDAGDDSIRGQQFDVLGNRLGTEFIVNTHAAN